MTTMFRPRQDALDPRVLTTLETRLQGTLIRPGDASYESQRRVWNGSIDRYPAGIARCADAADVTTSLRFARTHRLLVAVRGGGHSTGCTRWGLTYSRDRCSGRWRRRQMFCIFT